MLFIGGGQTQWLAVREALSELGISDSVVYIRGAHAALAHLGKPREAVPCVVLLSIDDIGGDGLDTLKVLKADKRLARVPVVVLASSNDVRLVNESFALGAAGYMVEPGDSRELAEAIRMIHQYWSLSEVP